MKAIPEMQKYYAQHGDRVPIELMQAPRKLESRLKASADVPIHNKQLLQG